jgi:putative CocE/NonD family hydrolase
VSQWRVAELNPPHLAAINPWEGWSDTYREVARHGGIPETYFWPYIQTRWGASDRPIEDLWAETAEHPLFDDFWASKAARLEQITAPAFVVASWSDHALHTRGTLEGYRRMASSQKWLEVHGRKKWAHYYDPDSVERQRAFFDHFLKTAAPVPEWPAVTLEVRQSYGVASHHRSTAWPLPELRYRRFHLDAAGAALIGSVPIDQSMAQYDSLAEDGEAIFDLRFEAETAIVGHARLKLHVSTDDGDDMDLFVCVEKHDAQGVPVPFAHYAVFEDGPVALGWLRLSHRELDETRSTEFLPVLAHRREWKVQPGEIVTADIEILPSGTCFAPGETLRLRIRGRDGRTYPKPMLYARHEETVNRGVHRIWTGGATDSWLQLPILGE